MADVSIIIVNYNTSNLTLDCVESIRTFTRDVMYEIIVVDNHSETDDVDRLKNNPYFTLVCNEKNLGFPFYKKTTGIPLFKWNTNSHTRRQNYLNPSRWDSYKIQTNTFSTQMVFNRRHTSEPSGKIPK